MMSLAALKLELADVAGIETLTETVIGGRRVYGLNGMVTAVDLNSDADATETAIRNTIAVRAAGKIVLQVETPAPAAAPIAPAAPVTPIPPVTFSSAPAAQPKGKPMTTPAPGSFAASIRAMMDEARAGVAQARADGLAKVGDAVGKLNDAKVATAKVAGNTAKMIEDEAAAVLSELGQLSNDL